MSFRVNASGEVLYRTSSLPSTTSVTMACWMRRRAVRNAYSYWGISNTSSGDYQLFGYTDINELEIAGTAGGTGFGSTPSVNVWFFGAFTCGGTGASDFKGYYAEVGDTSFNTATATGNSFTPAHMSFGNDQYDEWINGAFCAMKVWDTVLTETELWTERLSFFPRRPANLIFFNPGTHHSDWTMDWTGTADMTAGGSLSREPNPYLAWGAGMNQIIYTTAVAGGVIFPPNSLALMGAGR
jgi:hypothetical protein